MKKKYLVYILILIYSSLLLTGCTKDEGNDTSRVTVTDGKEETKEESTVEEGSDSSNTNDLGYVSNPDDYSKTSQSVGESSEGEYTLESIVDTSYSGYHSIQFNIQSNGDIKNLPLVRVEPVLSSGVARVTLNSISSDTSGIAFQSSRNIEKGGISTIYHAVTSKEKTSIYDIGIQGNNSFKLSSSDLGDGKWSVVLDVTYDTSYSGLNIDLGSTEFSSDIQDISGVASSDGAKILTYSYSVSNNILRVVFSVASGTSNPVPSVSASYDDSNILQLVFTSLESDKVSTWGKEISFPAGIKATVSRSGEQSTYSFGGIGAKNEFKLSASKSPNQVILEIKLK